jgi:hypothetical protein
MEQPMRFIVSLLLVLFVLIPPAAKAQTEVDLALVLAVDMSGSMDSEEQTLQREGFVEAFRSTMIHDAIREGVHGRIAVVYLEWADTLSRKVAIPWTVIDGPKTARDFADRLSRSPIWQERGTSISGAIDASVKLLDESRVEPVRRVIDISGDGANNQGRPLPAARDEALAKGITINGLPLILKRPNSFDIESLDIYYRDCVIGGPGAFMIPIRRREQFAEAIRDKLIREITGLVGEPEIIPVQVERRLDCLKRVD